MAVSAARYTIIENPAFCQISDPMYSGRNQSGDPMKNTGSPPNATMALLTMPERGENSRKIMPTTTTTEMKEGA